MNDLGPSDRIALIHLAGIGDLILAIPAIRAVRRRFPKSHLALIVARHTAHLLDHCPDLDAQWVLASPRDADVWRRMLADRPILQGLCQQRFALAVNLYQIASWPGSLRIAYYLSQIRPRVSMGYDTDHRGWCYAVRVPETQPLVMEQHESRHVEALVSHLGCASIGERPQLWMMGHEQHEARSHLAEWGIGSTERLAVLAAGGSAPQKRWPAERFAELGRWLIERLDATVLLVGYRTDEPLGRLMMSRLRAGRAVNAIGRTSVRELIGLISCARLVVTNDTGTMHIAAALSRPLAALFGPTSVVRFGPIGEPARQRVLQPPSRRIEDIETAEVQRAVEELWTTR